MRSPLIAGNWKMNGSSALIDEFQHALEGVNLPASVEVVLLPPYPYLAEMKDKLGPQGVEIGAQSLNPLTSGPHTGEVSGAMLSDLGVDFVLAGHSERRSLYHESDEDVFQRVHAALSAGLKPILCVGETLEERDSGKTSEVILRQVGHVMAQLDAQQRAKVVIAYEPVWAIGTGRTATPEQAQEVMATIRDYQRSFDAELAQQLRLLYGGSMNAGNAADLLAQPDIDGGLIGGASLKIDDFLTICEAAG
ncbi:triose-phosphate isomerase [Carnimonas bestiolae]|uniref:triose-phosphate isomerase n=1 Tax=Carnimonas bestiolae TaxID=3402172 RepID=UPI003EDC31C3